MEKNNQVKVSVIIPVYNVEKYLRQCLDSLLEQTCPDFEVICIDDGSSDDSVKILQEYTKKDSRFSYYLQVHKNCGAARNNGMSHATGKYLLFIDSDDLLVSNAIEIILTRAEKTNADICVYQCQTLDSQTGKRCAYPETANDRIYPTEVFSIRDNSKDIYRFMIPTAHSKLFRKDFIQQQQLNFQETAYSEDIAFVFTALALAERITVIAKPLYIYRVNISTSITGSKDRNPLGFYWPLLETRKWLIKRDLFARVEPAFINYAASCLFTYLNSCQSPKTFEYVYQFIRTSGIAELQLDDKPDEYFYAYPDAEIPHRLDIIQNKSIFDYVGKYGPDFGIIQQRMTLPTLRRTLSYNLRRTLKKILRALKVPC